MLRATTMSAESKTSHANRLQDVFDRLLAGDGVLSAVLVGPNGLVVAGGSRSELSTHLTAAVGVYLLDDATMIGSHLGETNASGVLVQWPRYKFFVLKVSRTMSLVLALRPDADIHALEPKVLEALSELDSLITAR